MEPATTRTSAPQQSCQRAAPQHVGTRGGFSSSSWPCLGQCVCVRLQCSGGKPGGWRHTAAAAANRGRPALSPCTPDASLRGQGAMACMAHGVVWTGWDCQGCCAVPAMESMPLSLHAWDHGLVESLPLSRFSHRAASDTLTARDLCRRIVCMATTEAHGRPSRAGSLFWFIMAGQPSRRFAGGSRCLPIFTSTRLDLSTFHLLLFFVFALSHLPSST
ncbi:hypothetical protein M440DRAFT_321198 [Trichoderma longibrachiatum ATCC 18648]|uniref:Uncharacterized protein n=1 Tax=Trichoderma longibrachiatum ATCC 18648 TaxID=983965 RepID=A0A2T4C4M9_TRILO|nr:hypothetical protein M440DRAFT_321198 [Trichoderma longibrachiatum ATCC 18648]